MQDKKFTVKAVSITEQRSVITLIPSNHPKNEPVKEGVQLTLSDPKEAEKYTIGTELTLPLL